MSLAVLPTLTSLHRSGYGGQLGRQVSNESGKIINKQEDRKGLKRYVVVIINITQEYVVLVLNRRREYVSSY